MTDYPAQGEKSAHLEIRVGDHFPTHLHLKDGTHLYEPPSIEGYLDRIKTVAPARQSTYLTTHDGLLFTLSPAHSHPPHPPSSIPPPPTDSEHGDFYLSLRNQEIRRGAAQIGSAHGVMDLRSVLVVRRAFHVEPHIQEHVESSQQAPWEEGGDEPVEMESEDVHDTGGEDGLSILGGDRLHKRVRRCFEIVTDTGRIIRYEAYSAKVAIEWIERLRALVRYWKKRHFIDTRQEMDVVHFALNRPRITPHRRWHEEDKLVPPEPPPDPNTVLPYISSMYHWCVMEGCRPITKTGRLYARRGIRGMYKLTQLFLVCGHLLQYDVKAGRVHHHRRGPVVNLLDAYTVSGVFAAQSLPLGQYDPNAPPTARRYQDGLECDDLEEDLLFIVYYFPHSVGAGQKAGTHATIPNLSAARKMLVFRTRSRVERDVWCWALNAEIEKVTRAAREREEKLRHAGDPVTT
ncbi:hypothetical protein EWM64_g4906 [Hericium alpestre]|uniref:PH domain-containing protein n=1 Tax=Hericium alpestre TaxID=135208 RepID=A0A4Y9ZWZ6_9AGAM|nr:hypothetical protein EWM64_g4906 [Hericium alpestre]